MLLYLFNYLFISILMDVLDFTNVIQVTNLIKIFKFNFDLT
ncbi:hypothetical protein NTHI1209_00639 [Haemophilus influenzae]|uniref:Uncharacterized protein n=1 Tax=Haemophilus influenzae TaxID=727 RepID=A0A158SVZ2_HAEIF|nr:hypothetical protein NTHI1209_00639 [Haemophilus influenzae]